MRCLVLIAFVCLPVHFVGFGPNLASISIIDNSIAVGGDGAQDEDERLIGGAVQRRRTQSAPGDPYRVTGVVKDGRYAPFPKYLSSCGIVLAATQGVPDEFLVQVGGVIDEILARRVSLDLTAQRSMVEDLHRYGALLPVPQTERSFERILRRNEKAFDRLHEQFSICDIIMAQVPDGQVMEVVEHVLHTVTDVGLHYQFPDDWGLSRQSQLWVAMQRAIDEGFYNVDSYDDLKGEPPEIVDRILLQEFAYWFITTAWDLQEPYGPDEEEWTLRTSEELKAKMPKFFDVYQRTAARVMSPPSRASLSKIGPPRSEERRRR